MPKLGRTESGRMYSWWWDSHISPKNSKWLQENLTDIDAKVKVMIKLIEEDADSFARRAEMYYKKRPELMRMVEEFYRAYRALAERYDHATGVIQHAHRTMAEAFPNQIPSLFDDSPVVSGTDPRTPEDRVFKHNGEFTSDSDTAARRKALKQQLNYPSGSIERVRKGLSFDETEEKESCRFEKLLKPDEEHEPEEILKLKESIAKLESEKEAGLVQYQESLDKLSQLESEISQAREDLRVFSDRATKAENEVVVLKESLSKLESEKELKLQEYERSLDKLSDLEAIISNAQEDAEKSNQRACIAETEAQSLRVERDKLATEKDAALDQYLQSLDAISNLEKKLRVTEEDATGLKERAEKAEGEIEILKLTISKLTDEKEAAALQYQQCLERISDLEDKLERAQDEAKQLNIEIDSGVSKLKGAEEKCLLLERSNQSLHSELDALMMKMGTQAQDLTEKQKEVGQLWGCVQEERLRFVEAETAFQTLQHLHAQTQEELRSRASELQKRAQHLKVSQDHNQSLQDEVLRVNEENKRLDELNESSSLSIKDMQNEISRLKDSTGKLEEEVELRLDERNALQQEIYCLKEELNDLQKKHHSVVDQVYMVGLNPESFGSSVRGLQDENSNLKENWDRERRDKTALLAKLEAMEQLLEKNAVLETSISDLNAELGTVRGKIVMLEQSVESLSKEKSALFDERATLVTQLQETKKNLQSLAENNTVMVNSLNDAYNQLEALKFKSKMLEDSCQLLKTEKADITRENDDLTFQLENTQKRLEEVGEYHGELKGRYIALEKERDSNLREVQELQLALEVARQERGNYIQISESRLMGVEAEICDLHKECLSRKKELDEVIDNALNFEIEMSVLQRTVQELKQENFSLALKNQELLEKFTLSEKIVSQLEKNNDEQQFEIKSLSDQASSLRTGTYQLLKVLDIVQDPALKDKAELFHINFDQLFSNVQDLKTSLCKAEEESHIWAVELSILIEWIKLLKLEVRNLEVERSNIEHEFKERTEQLLTVQNEVHKHLETNENLRKKLKEGDCVKELLMSQIEDLRRNLMEMKGACKVLRRENSEVYAGKKSLMEKFCHLEEKNNVLEEENYVLCENMLVLDHLSLIFRSYAEEKLMAVNKLNADRNKLHDMNGVLVEKLNLAEESAEESNIEILHLKQQLQRSADELKVVAAVKDQLYGDIENGKNVQNQMKLELQEAEQKINIVEKNHLVQLSAVQDEVSKHLETNENLRQKLKEGECAKEKLMSQIEDLRRNLMDMQGACEVLRREKSEVYEEKESLAEKFLHLEEKNNILEEENCVLCENMLSFDNLSLIFRSFSEEKLMAVNKLNEDRNKLHDMNGVLAGKLRLAEGSAEESNIEILHLKQQLQRSEDELKVVAAVKDQLCGDIENGKNVLNQMKLELQEAEQKMNIVEKNHLVQLSAVQDEVSKHLETNENLRQKLKEGDCVKVELMTQIEDLRRNLVDLQGACEVLRREKSKVYEEKKSLREKFLHLDEKNNVLEAEYCVLCDNMLALDNLSLIFRSFSQEILIAVNELNEDRNKLHDMNGVLVGKLRLAEGRAEESNIEILHLKQQLQRSEDELKVVAAVKDQLCSDIENGKNVLNQMELELQEAEQKISIVEKKKFELHKIVEDLKIESDEIKIIRDDQENQILQLSAKNDCLNVENNCLHEARQILEVKIQDLHEELNKSKSQGENLESELKMKVEEIEDLEIQATSVFGQLECSRVSQLLFEQKFHELQQVCLDYIDQNESLKNQVAAFRPEIASLKECVASLEKDTDPLIRPQSSKDAELQGAEVITDLQGNKLNKDDKAPVQDIFSDLRDLHARLQAYEKASAAIKEVMVQESIELHSKLDTSLKQIEFLKSESWRYRRSLKQSSEISEAENALLMKDIMLDQMSNGSPYGVSRRETTDAADQIVELWEDIDPKKNQKDTLLASDESIGIEPSVDKLELSKRYSGHVQEENKRKVLDRLDSDVQKLANLQIAVQDMKRKLQVTEKGKRGKSVIQCEVLKGQLEEADTAIMKLFDFNGKLIKTVESSTFADVKSSFDLEGDGKAKRRVSEQARRISEKIGRLQLEVQKLQFILLKLDDEKEGKSNLSDIRRRILLRDYLYGGRRPTGQGRKNAPFCGCFDTSTFDH